MSGARPDSRRSLARVLWRRRELPYSLCQRPPVPGEACDTQTRAWDETVHLASVARRACQSVEGGALCICTCRGTQPPLSTALVPVCDAQDDMAQRSVACPLPDAMLRSRRQVCRHSFCKPSRGGVQRRALSLRAQLTPDDLSVALKPLVEQLAGVQQQQATMQNQLAGVQQQLAGVQQQQATMQQQQQATMQQQLDAVQASTSRTEARLGYLFEADVRTAVASTFGTDYAKPALVESLRDVASLLPLGGVDATEAAAQASRAVCSWTPICR